MRRCARCLAPVFPDAKNAPFEVVPPIRTERWNESSLHGYWVILATSVRSKGGIGCIVTEEWVNFRQLAYGLISFLPFAPESLYKGTGGTSSGAYCYSVWLRHLTKVGTARDFVFPDVVAELGPGDSIGVGLAALLSGARRYIALDAVGHADWAGNLRVFDELVELFERRSPIPMGDAFPEMPFDPVECTFPNQIIPESRLKGSLSPDRVAYLRRLVSGEVEDRSVLDYRVPWGMPGPGDCQTVDFLLSNAVMEHVVDLPGMYGAIFSWLRPGAYSSHQIDFRSHSIFRAWDGHWACPEWLWRMFVGRRPYLLNREPFAVHRHLAQLAGFEEVTVLRSKAEPRSKRLSPRFRNMDPEDRATAGGYVLLRKPKN